LLVYLLETLFKNSPIWSHCWQAKTCGHSYKRSFRMLALYRLWNWLLYDYRLKYSVVSRTLIWKATCFNPMGKNFSPFTLHICPWSNFFLSLCFTCNFKNSLHSFVSIKTSVTRLGDFWTSWQQIFYKRSLNILVIFWLF